MIAREPCFYRATLWPPDPSRKRPPGRPRTKWTNQLRRDNNDVPIATLLVAVTRERRYGPSRLRVNDDDYDDAMLTRNLLPSSVRPSQAGIGRIELVFSMEASFYLPHSTRMLQGNSGISKIRVLPSGTLFQTLPRQVDRVVNKTRRRRRRRRRSRLLTTLIRKSTSRGRLLQVGQL